MKQIYSHEIDLFQNFSPKHFTIYVLIEGTT